MCTRVFFLPGCPKECLLLVNLEDIKMDVSPSFYLMQILRVLESRLFLFFLWPQQLGHNHCLWDLRSASGLKMWLQYLLKIQSPVPLA